MNFSISQQKKEKNPLINWLLEDNNPTRIKLHNIFFKKSMQYEDIFASQTCLAYEAGVSRVYTNRQVSIIDGMNTVGKTYRHRQTCIYVISPIIIKYRHLLWDKYPALKTLSLFLLHSSLAASLGMVFTPRYNNLINEHRKIRVERENPRFEFRSFKEPGFGGQITTHLFIKNKLTPNNTVTSKERVMDKTVINVIAEAYGLSVQQEELLSNYSDEALQYALKELHRQNKQNSLNNPVNWIAKVAANYKGKGYYPKTGTDVGHSPKARNPHGHSPSGEQSNLSYDERSEFAEHQESIWEEIVECSEDIEVPGLHKGYAERAKANWNRISFTPTEFPKSTDGFKKKMAEAELYTEGPEYEEHLNQISADKTDPEAYKRRIRITDYLRIARK